MDGTVRAPGLNRTKLGLKRIIWRQLFGAKFFVLIEPSWD
ncbi:hypothetical protein THTE_4323 [Thermogutta terrifontis]|uniref:Uncharacterized protein n=1 Tax=Thermogutta terrifontis TaxID=1331910 RepID=A0A286RLT6_9BACT|nr:hypothetical protein THTE_4323 [Thermogutta terrifontis]